MLRVLGFLTRFPVGRDARIEDIARMSYLFPAAGALIGISVAVFAFIISEFSSETALNAIMTLLFLYAITGLMHLDGLADFADGVFASGGISEKMRAMKDVNVGISGIFAVLLILLLNTFAINSFIAHRPSSHNLMRLMQLFIISEVSAKLSMNACMLFGKARLGGIGAYFIENFSYHKFIASLSLSLLLSMIFSFPFFPVGFYRFSFVLVGVAVAFLVSRVAMKNFGAVSGDVLGASNELARCVCFVIFAIAG